MKKCTLKVLIAAGGSGGHIFPAVALARKIKSMNPDVSIRFVGSRKALDQRIFEKEGFSYSCLSRNKLPYRMSPVVVINFLRFFIDLVKSFGIILRYRPNIIVGFGGYVSFPIMLSGKIFNIPLVSHEQNVSPGRSNKLLFKIVDKIAISFQDSRSLLGQNSYKAVFTGNPIRTSELRDDRAAGLSRFGLKSNKFTILVIGGSQGSHFLNSVVVEAFAGLDKDVSDNIQIIHLTGVKDYEWALSSYGVTGIEHRIYSFIDRIEEAYSACDLAVTRSGASAIFELALFARPMILIPYPFAMSHQLDNARVFSNKNAAILLEERGLTPQGFRDKMSYLINNRESLKTISQNARSIAVPDADLRLAEEVLKLVR